MKRDATTEGESLSVLFAEQEEDVISLAAGIELCAEQALASGNAGRVASFLEALWEQLREHPAIVGELGWDIPKVLVRCIRADNFNLTEGLGDDVVWRLLVGCFQEVGREGNARECFLTGCQQLAELSVAAEEEEDAELREEMFALKFHMLMEFVTTTLGRASTAYPSRFLGEIVGVLVKLVERNAEELRNVHLLLRRLYTFCRDYTAPQSTSEDEELHAQEDYLQRTLFQSFLAYVLAQLLRRQGVRWAAEYFAESHGLDFKLHEDHLELRETLGRYFQLAYSFDIDIEAAFRKQCILESREIYACVSASVSDKVDGAEVIYQLAYTYELKKIAELQSMPIDARGILVLAVLHHFEAGRPICPSLRLDDAIYMYLRFNTPEIYSKSFANIAVTDASLYFVLLALEGNSNEENHELVREFPPTIFAVFIQVLLLNMCRQPSKEIGRMTHSILARVLFLAPETTAFDFVIDTLLQCPYETAKQIILEIAKIMMISDKYSICTRDAPSQTPSDAKSPPLPPRPFIRLNDDRMAALHTLAMMSAKFCAESEDPKQLTTLLSYLNLISVLRKKWDQVLLREITAAVSNCIEPRKEDIPEIGFIKIANDGLKEFLEGNST
ncbi:AaceriAAR159Cp [[Ashbya] aceris (nom. inval.)]|nr:AaceriAAR159Cp [[Ashbya] aceris (nom. inval.)]